MFEGLGGMSRRRVRSRAQDLVKLARQLVQTPGLTWVEANNTIYKPGGPFARLFAAASDRLAFSKTTESREIDALIDSLPDPPVRPERK
jgi:hypothetical protein